MKRSASPFLVRVWMPVLLAVGVCLLFGGMPPLYWPLALPFLLVAAFPSTLAEIRNDGHRTLVKTLWNSMYVPNNEIVRTAESVLAGIGTLQLKRFVFPWGKIYFVADWSELGVESAESETHRLRDDTRQRPVRTALGSLAAAVSGFLAARGMSSVIHNPRVESAAMRVAACILAGTLCLVFAAARSRRPGFANVALFIASLTVGFILW